jgi:PAS domain S-box-containing protein
MSSPASPDPEPGSRPEELFDFLLETMPDQVYFKDRQGRFLRASRAVAEYLGVQDPREVIGKSDFDFWSLETAQQTAIDDRQIMETRDPMVGGRAAGNPTGELHVIPDEDGLLNSWGGH